MSELLQMITGGKKIRGVLSKLAQRRFWDADAAEILTTRDVLRRGGDVDVGNLEIAFSGIPAQAQRTGPTEHSSVFLGRKLSITRQCLDNSPDPLPFYSKVQPSLRLTIPRRAS